VTVLAVLDYIGAAVSVLFALLAFVGGAFMGAIISRYASPSGAGAAGAGIGAAIGAVIGVFLLIGGGISALLGWGMWNLKEWARILQIVFAAIGVLFSALGLLVALAHFRIFGLTFGLVRLAISAFIIYYLVQPHVKAAFGAPPAVSYAPPVPPAPPAAGAGS
jgi:hypothetical protein